MRRLTVPTLAAAVLLFPMVGRAQRYTEPTASCASRSPSSRSRRTAPSPGPRRWPTAAFSRSSPTWARRSACRKRRSRRTRTPSTAAGSGSAWRSATSPTSSRRTSATATSPSACYATCPSMPGHGRRTPALRPDARADPDRHAVARRASRLQHAGNDAQRIARRDAGGRRHRPRAAAHAARRASRSAAVRPPRRHGRRAAHRSARAAAARRFADRAAERRRSAARDAGRVRAARSTEPAHRQDLRPHRHGRARSARGDGAPEQGAERSVERAAGRAVREDLRAAIRRRRRSASRRFRRRTRAACRSRRSTG